jgi:hypothetical protein
MLRLVTMNMVLGGALALGACATPVETANVRSATSGVGTPASTAAVGVNGRKLAANNQVCRREVVTGALMPKIVCRTRAEWARISGEDEANKERALERSNQSRRPGN